MTLRKTYKTWHKAKETAEKLKGIVNDKFSDETLYAKFCNAIHENVETFEIENWLDNLDLEEHE